MNESLSGAKHVRILQQKNLLAIFDFFEDSIGASGYNGKNSLYGGPIYRKGDDMRWFCVSLSTALLVAVSTSPASAQLTSPQVGWEADFNEVFHDVTGNVSVLNPNTLLFDGFTYDGGGPAVYFYLGTEDSQSAFAAGLSIGMLLSGTVYDGTQPPFEVDLPTEQTMEGWNAISVWCADFQVNFGSGTFAMPGDFDKDGDTDGGDFLFWQRNPSVGSLSDWEAKYGTVALLSVSTATVPEPTTYGLALLGCCLAMFRPCH